MFTRAFYYCSITQLDLEHNSVNGGFSSRLNTTKVDVNVITMTVELFPRQSKSVFIIQGGPEKNGTGYFPQYVDAITGISVWGNFS